MQVEALANSLHMRFFAPRIENEPEPWTMRNIYNSWTYHVRYWKNGSDEKVSAVNHARCRCQLPVLRTALAGGHDDGEKLCQVAAPYGPEDLRPGPLSSRRYPFWGWLVCLVALPRLQGQTSCVLVQENKPFSPQREIAGEGQADSAAGWGRAGSLESSA